jgi:hypothetical protein
VVFVVIEPVDHGRVFGQGYHQVAIVAHAHTAEHADLIEQLIIIIHLGITGGKHMVPEERHLLL